MSLYPTHGTQARPCIAGSRPCPSLPPTAPPTPQKARASWFSRNSVDMTGGTDTLGRGGRGCVRQQIQAVRRLRAVRSRPYRDGPSRMRLVRPAIEKAPHPRSVPCHPSCSPLSNNRALTHGPPTSVRERSDRKQKCAGRERGERGRRIRQEMLREGRGANMQPAAE
jgi:hypothetical protein